MTTTTTETTLLSFCELLNRWREGRRRDDLSTALAAVEAAAQRGEGDVAELMCHAIGAVTGIRISLADWERWPALAMH